MTAKRNNAFPSTSIGRTQGTHILRTSSFEFLSAQAHPLLTPAAPIKSESTVADSPSPTYVPYTPRHRVPSPSVTTGATVDSSVTTSPQQHDEAATNKLHLMNLKAAAQDVGLGTSSLGWAMLEKIMYEGDRGGPEWAEIWNSITKGKVRLYVFL